MKSLLYAYIQAVKSRTDHPPKFIQYEFVRSVMISCDTKYPQLLQLKLRISRWP